MAESAVAFLIKKLDVFLSSQLDLIIELDINISSLQNDLALLQVFLKDVDARQRDSERVKVWISQVRNVAFRAEDAIDRYLYEVEFQKRHGFLGSLRNCANHARHLRIRHHLGTEIEGINKMLQKIMASRLDFGIEFGQYYEGEALDSLKKVMPIVEETDVVGFEQDLKILSEKLTVEDPRRTAVSIVGMGGLGKTTLARKVYNSDDVKKHFDCQAWVYISQKWDNRELLQVISEQYGSASKEEIAKMKSQEMEGRLKQYLSTKKYLLVIDDIWKPAAWDVIRGALPKGKDGSRIIVTTRREEVARYVDPQGFIHKPQCLGEEESWDLFCLRAFGSKGGYPKDLREVGKEMVSKCAGLPLAITVLGGLLSRKQNSEIEWRKVLKRITYELHEGEDGQNIQRILALSFDALPYYLRSCFLYFGLFPEDSEIDAEKLIQLWVAEGFIQERGQQTMEEVAEDYLGELVDRSMIQVVRRNLTGGVRKCRIHDLLLDLALSQGKEEKFLCVVAAGNHLAADNASSAAAPRRVAIHGGGGSFSINDNIPLHPSWRGLVRSMFWYLDDSEFSLYQVRLLVHDLKLLRVLNLKQSNIERLPKQIGLLVHLKFLGLEDTHVTTLPSSVGMLRNLQTLRLSGYWCSLPGTLLKIETLMHIIGNAFDLKGASTGKGVNYNAKLQTLGVICGGSWMGRCLGKFTNLRVLKILGIRASHAATLPTCLEKMTCLNQLGLEFWTKEGTMVAKSVLAGLAINCRVLHELAITDYGPPDVISCSDRLSGLFRAALQAGRRKSQLIISNPQQQQQDQSPLQFPSSLVRLKLGVPGLIYFSEQQWGLGSSLQGLPNLKILVLVNNVYSGKVMVFTPHGFPKLEELQFWDLDELEECIVDNGAMPCLKCLYIDGCRNLKTLPEGLQHITTLQELRLSDMPMEFIQRLKEEGGDDWCKIRHIPSVTYDSEKL